MTNEFVKNGRKRSRCSLFHRTVLPQVTEENHKSKKVKVTTVRKGDENFT
jgi:hypothetical protein